MRVGKLSRRALIETPGTPTRDSAGQAVPNWATYSRPWVQKLVASGREDIKASEINTEMLTTFCLRYDAGVDESMRITYEGRIYQIVLVDNINGRNRELQIRATLTGRVVNLENDILLEGGGTIKKEDQTGNIEMEQQ